MLMNQKKSCYLPEKKIGWINCDRIIYVHNPCELEVVLADVTDEFTVRLALSKRNVVVAGLVNSNYFIGLPI